LLGTREWQNEVLATVPPHGANVSNNRVTDFVLDKIHRQVPFAAFACFEGVVGKLRKKVEENSKL
jgi:hypothetical protein